MKKSVVLLLSLFFVLGLGVFASAKTPAQPAHKLFSGTVDKVTPADPTTNTKAQIVVLNAPNKRLTFTVADNCTYYDAKGGAIAFDKIVKGVGVAVTYTTNPQGAHTAISIKLLH